VTKFYEKNCDIFAHKIWKKAYPDLDHAKVVSEVYGKMESQIISLPYLDQADLYNSTYTYNRLEVNNKLVKATLEVTPVVI